MFYMTSELQFFLKIIYVVYNFMKFKKIKKTVKLQHKLAFIMETISLITNLNNLN